MLIGLAQLNPTIGDFEGNYQKILDAYLDCASKGAELVITPELAVTGYPPQDLVFKSRFVPTNIEIIQRLHAEIGKTPLAVGYVDFNEKPTGKPFRNACALLEKGKPITRIFKTLLPSYDVFDEARYFEPAESSQPIEINGQKVGFTICEDIWTEKYLTRHLYHTDPVTHLVSQGARVIVNLSSSPFQVGKPKRRVEMICELARQHQSAFHYCNAVGANDQLIFDGNSIVVNAKGLLVRRLAAFEEEIAVCDDRAKPQYFTDLDEPNELFQALVLGVRDYVQKCGFRSVILGLSGGIDSAVTACVAAEALGPENVTGVAMPSQFSSRGSVDDAQALAKNLGLRWLQIPIREVFDSFKRQFKQTFEGLPEDTTEENMQARLRGNILMSLSNKFGHLLLTTGNKSELAVGYCTMYGDMAGGLAVISDVPKTMVYRLARWINRATEVIPIASIEKPPSAELRLNQTDQDTLPPYEILDEILRLYIEEQLSTPDIINRGFASETVRWVIRRIDLNEYKRQQAAPGLKVTSTAFGMGRRIPIAQSFQS